MRYTDSLGSLTRIAVFFAIVSFSLIFVGPIDVFLHNINEFSSTPTELISTLLIIAGTLFFPILIVLYFSPRVIKNVLLKVMAFQRSEIAESEFVKCGLGHVVALLDKLKKLGIYDKTMIVLSSDHGDYWIDESVDVDKFESHGIPTAMFTRASSTLAIKPFGARGLVVTTQAPVLLRDIPHTILAANGLEQEVSINASSETRDVFSVSPTEDREREFLSMLLR